MPNRPRLLLGMLVLLASAGCAGFLGARGKNCPNGADLYVNNQSREAIEVVMTHQGNERVLGLAGMGTSTFRLPDGVGRDARFKARPARARPSPDPGFDSRWRGNVSFNVRCR